MGRIKIGRTVRRLRLERDLSQQALANRLGISASYLNLIEHDQRAVSGSLLIRLAETLHLDLAALSGAEERKLEVGLREVFCDPLLGADAVPQAEITALAGSSPQAARAVLALYRAWRVAREDALGIALPSGRRVLLPNEEARDFFDDRANHFPSLEEAADEISAELNAPPAEMNHAFAERLRSAHGLTVIVQPLEGVRRRFDPAARRLALAETLPRESRGFQMAFQLALLETREVVENVLNGAAPSSAEAAMLIRVGLLNYVAGALLMPYAPFLAAARGLRHDIEAWQPASELPTNRPAIGSPPCSGLARAACRSSFCASTLRAMYRSASRRRVFRLHATAAPARAGSCTRPLRSRARSACRSQSCRTARLIFVSPAPW
jgi:transcriptional regulator with XRE-family HTH domain